MKQFMRKKPICIISAIFAVIFVIGAGSAACYFTSKDVYRGTVTELEKSLELDATLTQKQAKSDLKYIYQHLKARHPAWIEKGSPIPKQVKTQYEAELAAFGETVTVLQLWQAASRMTALMHDGHTGVSWNTPTEARYIDNFSVLKEYGNPSSINGTPINSIMESYKESASFERDAYAEKIFYNQIICSEESLRKCGVDTSNGAEMAFLTQQGEITKQFSFVPIDQVKGYEKNTEEQNWVRYTIDQEKNLGIFTLKSCRNDEEYLQVLEQFFEEVFAAGITNIAVDLRGNGGGNSSVANSFLEYIDIDSYNQWASDVRYGWYNKHFPAWATQNQRKEKVFKGQLYVLTDLSSFSASMDFAMIVADNDLGVLVGEASGNLPDCYIDKLSFQTPNAKLPFYISYKKNYRIDASKSGQPLTPDYEVPSQQAMDKVYELIS